MDNKIDYAETLFESIQTLIDKSLTSVSFDQTINCTIVNNDNRSRGEYLVDDGASVFTAYSENTTYKVDTSVYVIIPQGDYNNKKIILGRRVSSDNEDFNYVSPLETYVDITSNIINNDTILFEEYSILANGDETIKLIGELTNLAYTGYNRLGIKANFRTAFGELKPIAGDYGLALQVEYVDDDGNTKKSNLIFSTDDMYGDVYNFIAYFQQETAFDISAFNCITGIRLYLYQKSNFKSQLKDNSGNSDKFIPHTATFPSFTSEQEDVVIPLPDNIFVNNLYLSLGYSLDDFDDDTVIVYLNKDNTSNYSIEGNKTKIINTRWVHRVNNSFNSIENIQALSGVPANLYWYKYNLAIDSASTKFDAIGGIYWEKITSATDQFQFSFNCDGSVQDEYIKAVFVTYSTERKDIIDSMISQIESGDIWASDSVPTELKQVLDNYINDNNTSWVAKNTKITNLLNNLQSNINNTETQQSFIDKYIELFNSAPEYDSYTSQIQLHNTDNVAANLAVDLVQSLSIKVGAENDPYNGAYYVYGDDGQILNNSLSVAKQLLTLTYNSLYTGNTDFDGVETITWFIPLQNTMIKYPENGIEYDSTKDTIYYCNLNKNIVNNLNEAVWMAIKREVDGSDKIGEVGTTTANTCQQYFRIKDYYTSTGNNIIECIVERKGYKYSANILLLFGTSGTNGTDYTFRLVPSSNIYAIDRVSQKKLILTPVLYDYNNQQINITDTDTEINYYICSNMNKWINLTETSEIELIIKYVITDNGTLELNSSHPTADGIIMGQSSGDWKNLYSIIKAEVNITKQQTLTAYYAISQSLDINQYSYYEGPTTIIYDDQGKLPKYYKDYIKLYNINGEIVPNVSWNIYYTEKSNTSRVFYPQLVKDGNNNYYLKPPTMYIKELYTCYLAGSINDGLTTIWVQPLIIMQNTYGSALINNWDGSMSIDEQNNTLLTAMIGAGSKNSNNQFSGVLMGDVQKADSDKKLTGIYGYADGVQTFSLTEDGTAVLGAAGKGQITLNGDSGTIQSGNYIKDASGMKIDLTEGQIDAYNFKLTSNLIQLDSSEKARNYFSIYGNGDITRTIYTYDNNSVLQNEVSSTIKNYKSELIKIGKLSYFLKTLDFNNTINQESGFKLDLTKGTLEAYSGFKLNAINHKIKTGTGEVYTYPAVFVDLIEADDNGKYAQSYREPGLTTNKNTGVEVIPNFVSTDSSLRDITQQQITENTLNNYYYWLPEVYNGYSNDWSRLEEFYTIEINKNKDNYITDITYQNINNSSSTKKPLHIYKKVSDQFKTSDHSSIDGTKYYRCESTDINNRLDATAIYNGPNNWTTTITTYHELENESPTSTNPYYYIRAINYGGKEEHLILGIVPKISKTEIGDQTKIVLTITAACPISDLYLPVKDDISYTKGELIFNANDNKYPLKLQFGGATPFKLSWAGCLTTTNFQATGGAIGGWKIENKRLYIGPTDSPYIQLVANGSIAYNKLKSQNKTSVTYEENTPYNGAFIRLGNMSNGSYNIKIYETLPSDGVTTTKKSGYTPDDIGKYFTDGNGYKRIVSTSSPYYEEIYVIDKGGITLLADGTLIVDKLQVKGGGGVWEGFARYTDANSHTHNLSGNFTLPLNSGYYQNLYVYGELTKEIYPVTAFNITASYSGNSNKGLTAAVDACTITTTSTGVMKVGSSEYKAQTQYFTIISSATSTSTGQYLKVTQNTAGNISARVTRIPPTRVTGSITV